MVRFFKWFYCLSKRLYKNAAFIIVILLIPLSALAFKLTVKKQEGFFNIAVVNEDSGLTVADKIFGSTAWNAARNNEKFMKDFDRLHVTGNSLDLAAGRNNLGARLVGFHNGCRIWVYDEIYKVGNDKVNFVPKDKVLAIGEGVAAKLYFGCVGNVKDGWFMGERFAKTFYDEDDEEQKLIVKSRPLAVLQQADGIAWAKVVNLG